MLSAARFGWRAVGRHLRSTTALHAVRSNHAFFGARGEGIAPLQRKNFSSVPGNEGGEKRSEGSSDLMNAVFGSMPEPLSGMKTEKFPVDKSLVGFLIGKRGANIRSLEEQTGAKVSINKEDGNVVVSTTEENMEKAVQLIHADISRINDQIKSFAERPARPTTPQASGMDSRPPETSRPPRRKQSTETMRISSSKVGVLIGTGGATLKDLEQRNNCRVFVDANSADRAETTQVLVRADSPEDVSECMKQIDELMENTREQPRLLREVMVLSDNDIGTLIGKGGATIMKIKSETNCGITVSPRDLSMET
eukprot:CAMPEP_0181314294 /NCGR_PEP_ID=MMETSP1101-20121128/14736_1 /TAXON_ID=46948 /ORGANISM="Rhodomonas abbreviata, Strain Caron Lab Isolate" /LENGTH=308 /DNA_ID=CAMNT_0023421367 /DNA_START=1 /DNA_END=923 /DNA_ORIENTATION=-